MSWGCQLRHAARYPPSLETGQLWGKGLGQTWKNSLGHSPESIRLSRVQKIQKTYTNPPQAAEAQTSPREVRTDEHSRHERCLKTLWDILSARVQSTWFLEQLHVSLVVFDILLIHRPSGGCKFASICWMLMCLPGLVRPLGPWALGPQPDMITEPKAPLSVQPSTSPFRHPQGSPTSPTWLSPTRRNAEWVCVYFSFSFF